jgi:arylformamidase
VPETLSGMELLEQFRMRVGRLVFVVDEYGVVQGLMTPRDLLEAITGELQPTPPPTPGPTSARDDGAWLLDGLMPVSELRRGWTSASCPRRSAAATTRGRPADGRVGPAADRRRAHRMRGLDLRGHGPRRPPHRQAGFRFVAPSLVQRGLHVAMVNYPLCPSVSLAALTETVRSAMPAVLAHADAALPLIAAGHSAGGHLAMEMGLTDWAARGLPTVEVAGVLALSGLYDLVPLARTSLNENLRLDADSAMAASPLYRAVSNGPPLLLAAGADETPAMREQSRRMHEVWLAMGNHSALHFEPGTDHFSLLQRLVEPGSALGRQVDLLLEHALS